MTRLLSLLIALLCLSGCATQRPSLPVGYVPEGRYVTTEDRRYGQLVLAQLADRFPLSRNEDDVRRVRKIVDRLARAANADQSPWNVYVFSDPTVKNAAATRGNFVFTWTGMLDSVQSEGELATVLAHEVGHVLAGHTVPDPAEQAQSMVSGAVSKIGGTILSETVGSLAGSVGESILQASMDGLLVNPESQRKELEADEVGIFLMADAGYDPFEAIQFWSRMQNSPEFRSATLQFLSTHPASKKRLQELEKYLPEAQQRYQDSRPSRRGSSLRTQDSRDDWVLSPRD